MNKKIDHRKQFSVLGFPIFSVELFADVRSLPWDVKFLFGLNSLPFPAG
jgi:hypothetical protein